MRNTAILFLIIISLISVEVNASPLFGFHDIKKINIISTSDIHGRLDGYDYNTGVNLPLGLDRISSIIKKERLKDKDAIILDAGDFNRGNQMVDVYNTLKADETNPVVNIMNMVGYDAVTPGNHEFDYGKFILLKIKREADFPLISANIFYNDKLLFKPYTTVIKKGVKIGIVGFTTPSAIRYNCGDDIEGIKIKDLSGQAVKYLSILRDEEKVDIIVAIVHSGIEGIYKAPSDETDIIKITELPDKPDVIISGHSHMVIPCKINNDTIIQSPGAMALGAGKVQLTVGKKDGRWHIIKKAADFIPSFTNMGDVNIKKVVKQYRKNTISYINTKIGRIKNEGIETSNEIIDIIKQKGGNADLVISENLGDIKLKNRELTVYDIYKLYGRENYIVGITTKGINIKKYIENRFKSNSINQNIVFPLKIQKSGNNMELYLNNKKVNDDEDINVVMTGRQLKYDVDINKSGIASGRLYYDSSSYGFEGRVRQMILNYIRNGEL